MFRDIYLLIGLHLPLHSLPNYLSAVRIDINYFWKCRVEKDYSISHISPDYRELYNKYYNFTTGKANSWLLPYEPCIESLPRTPLPGEVLTYYFSENTATLKWIHHHGKLYKIPTRGTLTIPSPLKMLDNYPLDYWSDVFSEYCFYLKLSCYRTQILENERISDTGLHYISKFTDWRNKLYIIRYENPRVILVTTRYWCKHGEIYQYML
jgi:hypothetical protein